MFFNNVLHARQNKLVVSRTWDQLVLHVRKSTNLSYIGHTLSQYHFSTLGSLGLDKYVLAFGVWYYLTTTVHNGEISFTPGNIAIVENGACRVRKDQSYICVFLVRSPYYNVRPKYTPNSIITMNVYHLWLKYFASTMLLYVTKSKMQPKEQ